MAYPYTETTWSNGVTAVSAANMNKIEDGITAARTFVGCRLFLDSDQSIPNGTPTAIVWTDEHFDPQGFWSSGSSITVPADHGGYYLVVTQVNWVAGNAGELSVEIAKNGSLNDGQNGTANASAADDIYMQASSVVALTAGQTVQVQVRQDTGVARSVDGSTSGTDTWVALTYLGY